MDDLILLPSVPQEPSALLGSVAVALATLVFIAGATAAWRLAWDEWTKRRDRR